MSDDDDDDILLDNDEISSLFEQDFGATQDAKQDAARLANELAKHELWLKANKSELKVGKTWHTSLCHCRRRLCEYAVCQWPICQWQLAQSRAAAQRSGQAFGRNSRARLDKRHVDS